MRDLATGLICHWTFGTELSEWAATVLMADCVAFPEDLSPDEDAVLGLLWDASSGNDLTDEQVAQARRLASA